MRAVRQQGTGYPASDTRFRPPQWASHGPESLCQQDSVIGSTGEFSSSRHLSVDMVDHLPVGLRKRAAVGSITAGRTGAAVADSAHSHNVVGQLMGQRSQGVPSFGTVEDYHPWVWEQREMGLATVPTKKLPSLSVRCPDKYHRHGWNVRQPACRISKCLHLLWGRPCEEPQFRSPALDRVQGDQRAVFMSRDEALLQAHNLGRWHGHRQCRPSPTACRRGTMGTG